jgi:SAM-dependent methyltransferase
VTELNAFPDHFSKVAARYAASRPAYPAELYEFVARTSPATRRVWDCATGTGQAAIGLSKLFSEVFATDASAEQLRNSSPGGNIKYSVQRAERTDFPDRYFDAVTVAQALHWFSLDDFKREIDRVLLPEGVLIVWTYGFFQIAPEIDDVLREELIVPVAPYWPPETAITLTGYADVEFPFEAIDVPEMSMQLSWNLTEFLGYLSTWSAANKFIAIHGPGLFERVAAALASVWGDSNEPRIVEMDFFVRGWRKPLSG